ncbi:MAG TPA: DUF5615 family PIN-like protein [Jatrophihabitantaceae bacterium]|nr:DUF5615 family PIN-like protein [Jatrophihabitantaceae bacterium]
MKQALLLDEHYSDAIAAELRAAGHDVVAVVADPQLRAQSDPEVYRHAAASGRRLVTENVKDFRPLLQQAYVDRNPIARLLLVPPNRFPRGTGRRATVIVGALRAWLAAAEAAERPDEDWLV